MTADPGTPELRRAVLRRDGQCIAGLLGYAHLCADAWGNLHAPTDLDRMQLDHVKFEPAMGARAPSDMLHLATLCGHAHLQGWATANRPRLRAYLSRMRMQIADHIDCWPIERSYSPEIVARSVMADIKAGVL
mgnify:CR=1 FL=1